jgi:CRP-like cAMP-binding protein
VFGEMAILNQGHLRSANVKALSDLRLLAIPIPLLDPLLRAFPRLRENLQNLVAGRLLG